MDDDEDICPVCDSVCTCNHQSPNRGSARANGYQPKRRGPSRSGKGEAFMATIRSEARSRSSLSAPDEPATTPKPLKIRLILGQRKPSSTPAAPVTLPPRSESPSPSRRRRSVNYTSSSESSHSASSKTNARQYPRYTSPSPEASRQLSPSLPTQGNSDQSQKRRGRPPKHATAAREAAARETSDFQGVFKEAAFGRPIRASAAVASSSLNASLAGPSRPSVTPSSSAGPSKPPQPQPKAHTPSSAWFLGAPPPKSLNRTPKSASGSTRALSQTSITPRHGSGHDSSRSNALPVKRTFPPTPKPKVVVKSTAKPHTKKALNTAKPPRISNAASNKKRRKGPAYSSKFGGGADSSLGELTPSEDEAYREEDYLPAPSLVSRTYSSSRGKPKKATASQIPSTGVVIGRPVGVTPGAYPKYVSISSSSDDSLSQGDEDTSDDEEEEDEDIMMEEERMIVKEEKKKEKQKEKRKQRESGSSGADKNHQHKSPRGSDMDISSSLSSLSSSSSKSSSSSSGSSADSDAETDEDDSDEDEDDADADDIPVHTAEAGEWTESEEEEMDADLFFANFLSDEDDAEIKEESSHSSAENDAEAAAPSVKAEAEGDGGQSDDDEADIFGAGFGVNGTSFVDADAFELLQRRRLFRHGRNGGLSRSRGSRGHPYRRPQANARKSLNKPPDASMLITEDPDGRLMFTNSFKAGKGLVDMEWEERQRAVMLNDEDVTSEESLSEADAMMDGLGGAGEGVNDDDDDDAESTTETDFEGDTTFDEGLDEDGLPPQMAEQSQQLRSEREFNQRRLGHQLHPSDYSVPVIPEVLPPGVEVFQGGYSTVMYGRFDFPSLDPLGPHGRLTSTTDFPDVWTGIQEEEKSVPDDGGNVKDTPTPFHFSVPPVIDVPASEAELPLITSPTPREILTASQNSLDNFRFPRPAAPSISPTAEILSPPITADGDHGLAVKSREPESSGENMLDAGDFRSSPEQVQTPPAPPPRRLPTMGAFVINPAPPVDPVVLPSQPVDDAHVPMPNSATSMTDSITTATSTSVIDTSSRPSTTSTPRKTCFFEPGPKGVAVIDDLRKSNIPSPYASVKRRKKPRTTTADESDGSVSMGHRSDAAFNQNLGFWNPHQMKRTTSVPASNRSSFSQSLPTQTSALLPAFDGSVQGTSEPSFLHPAHVLDPSKASSFGIGNLFGARPAPTGPIDLSDVLDSAFLEDEDESGVASDVDEDDGASTTTDHQGALRNLTRWDRVPMGTFRRARAFGSAGGVGSHHSRGAHPIHRHQVPSSPAGVSDGFSYGAMFREPDPFGPTAAGALWSDASPGGVRVVKGKGKDAIRAGSSSKIKRRPRIVISPVIFPIKEEEVPSGEPDDIDMGLVTGVEEEEGYFSKKLGKGGRDGTERERKKRKAERETTSSRSPVLKRAKSGATVVGDDSPVASA